jgi:nucleotide-binding universal stress UspA family protein
MKIMMYYDGTEHTKEALPVVTMRAKAFNAQVFVVSSLSKGGESQLNEIEKREDDLANIKSILEDQNISCETHLLIKGHGAGEDISDFAKEHKVDEIIIGTNRKSMVENLYTGWMAHHVISNARCPVVLA